MRTHLEEEVLLQVFLTSLPDDSGWSASLTESLRSERQRPIHAEWNVSWAQKAV